MPEYLAPGVYVEETSFRSKSIEGVSTTTTGFVGPARYGPVNGDPVLVTSLGEFGQTFGDGQPLEFTAGVKTTNYLWHAARAFFEEGGKRLYVARVFKPKSATADGRATKTLTTPVLPAPTPPVTPAPVEGVKLSARYPGAAGTLNVQFTLDVGQNVLSFADDPASTATPKARVRLYSTALQDRDVVVITPAPATPAPATPPPLTGKLFVATRDAATGAVKFNPGGGGADVDGASLVEGREVRIVRVSLAASLPGGRVSQFTGLSPDPLHQTAGRKDSLLAVFDPKSDDTTLPLAVLPEPPAAALDGIDVIKALFTGPAPALGATPNIDTIPVPARGNTLATVTVVLTGGDDGLLPDLVAYTGADGNDPGTQMSGLKALESAEDISIVAAPGHTAKEFAAQRESVTRLLISHAERMRYRIAVLDGPEDAKLTDIRAYRAKLDSTYAALYYPWVTVLDPITDVEINLPPSGFVSGIYARNDSNFAVYKAPANEPVRLALGFAETVNQGRQEVLNPEGINCFRFFEGRGNLLWGARTISSDQEWKYVNLRRYFAYLERSIDRGSQYAVFMPNGERLWANVRRSVAEFLLNEWQSGALLGDRPEKAYFVRCDRTTMTQNDLDNGRLVCLVGVAPLRPAEFVVFRIGQWTGDAR